MRYKVIKYLYGTIELDNQNVLSIYIFKQDDNHFIVNPSNDIPRLICADDEYKALSKYMFKYTDIRVLPISNFDFHILSKKMIYNVKRKDLLKNE